MDIGDTSRRLAAGKLYVIAGATATGKSAVALELARRVGGEIISADSMQIYTGMDIGTAKPTPAERAEVPHHLLDIARPDEAFSAARYARLARAAIAEIRGRGATPILCGGTGFYINAAVYGTEFAHEQDGEKQRGETEMRTRLEQLAREKGAAYLHGLLAQRDPAAAEAIHANNIKRVARALAFCEVTNTLFSAHNAVQRGKRAELPPDTVFVVLTLPRQQLHARIEARTEEMLRAGFVAEVQGLIDAGYSPYLPAMQAIGYKEIAAAISVGGGEVNMPVLASQIAAATRQYAKRQITWFKNNAPHARYLDVSCADAGVTAQVI